MLWHSGKTKLTGVEEGKARSCMVNDGSITIDGNDVPVVPSHVGIPYLGAMIQLDLGWKSQLDAINGTIRGFCNAVGRYRDMFAHNIGRAVWALNTFLVPKLVYRLCFVNPKVSEASGWDQQVRKCLGSLVQEASGCPQAIKPAVWACVTGLRLPSQEERMLKVTELFFRLNAADARSWSARSRWAARPRSAGQRCATNRSVRATAIAESFGWNVKRCGVGGGAGDEAQRERIRQSAPDTGVSARFELDGQQRRAVGNHCVLWRRGERDEQWPVVNLFTDGSWYHSGLDGRSAPVSAWAVIVRNDWLCDQYSMVEAEGRISRATMSQTVFFGGRIEARDGEGNYDAELQAIARALTVVPVDTSVVIHTDSRSSIEAIGRYRSTSNVRRKLRMAGRLQLTLINRLMQVKNEEGAEVKLAWVKAHTKEASVVSLESVGNRLADHVAGVMCRDTGLNSFRCQMAIPWGDYDPFVTIEDSKTGRPMTGDPRRAATKYLVSESLAEWSASESQSRFSAVDGGVRDLWQSVMAEQPRSGGLVMAVASDVVQWAKAEVTDVDGKVSSSYMARTCSRCGRVPGRPTRRAEVDSISHWVDCPRWSVARQRSAEMVLDIVSENSATVLSWSPGVDHSLPCLVRALGLHSGAGGSALTAACYGAFDRRGASSLMRMMGRGVEDHNAVVIRRIRAALFYWVTQVNSSLRVASV